MLRTTTCLSTIAAHTHTLAMTTCISTIAIPYPHTHVKNDHMCSYNDCPHIHFLVLTKTTCLSTVIVTLYVRFTTVTIYIIAHCKYNNND